MHLKISSAKWRPFFPGGDELKLNLREYTSLNTRRANINPLRAKLFRRNINIYLHFVSILHIDTTQVVEIPLQIRQEPTYAT